MSEETKTCPFCAETIKAAAVLCRYCGKDLPSHVPAVEEDPERAEAKRLGIEWSEQDKRWIYKGSYFGALGPAIQFAKTGQDAFSTGPAGPPAPAPRKTKWWVWPIGAIGLFLLWALLRTPSPEEEAKRRARAAIELCWNDQKRKSLDPGTARFVAGACEELERRFLAQYGVRP